MQAGDVLENRYHLIELVGRGRSEVFLARDENLTGKLLAVKVIQKTSKDFDSFQRETLLLAKLNHPGIPIITQQIETETECCVIMNYYNGETLHHYVERIDNGVSAEESLDRQQRENKVIEIFKSICEILIYIHSLYKNNDSGIKAPVIHRDIKPENIMLADSGIKLIDWGIAGEFKRGVPDVGPSWGTPWYAAPEQFASGAKYIDERTDIFSLGATMYYAISSVVPSKDKKNIRPISSVMPDISEGLGIIIDKCMKYNPEDRYQTASELLEDLNHVDSLSRKTRSEKQKSLWSFRCSPITRSIFTIQITISARSSLRMQNTTTLFTIRKTEIPKNRKNPSTRLRSITNRPWNTTILGWKHMSGCLLVCFLRTARPMMRRHTIPDSPTQLTSCAGSMWMKNTAASIIPTGLCI